MPPDLVVVTLSLALLQAVDHLQRTHLFPHFPRYLSLPGPARYDFDRRVLNLQTHLLTTPFLLYLVLLDPAIPPDYLYSYPPHAHLLLLLLLSAYLHDTSGLVMHPQPPPNARVWLFHHALAGGLILWDVTYRRVSAFPAATFLVAGSGHVVNEMRWLARVAHVNRQWVVNMLHVGSALVCLVTCALPPPYLLVRVARQLGVSVIEVMCGRMRAYCTFFFLLIYVPHVILVGYQGWRAIKSWGQPLPPFRPKKTD